MQRREDIEGISNLNKTRVRALPKSDLVDFESVETGIFFVHAVWSPQSIIILSYVAKCLEEMDEPEGIELVVADNDGVSSALWDRLRQETILGGYGESFWIRNGVLIAARKFHSERDYTELIAELLKT